MMPSTRFLGVSALAGLVSACSAFYVPKEKHDGVERCDNVSECEVPDDTRWDVECVFGDGQDESSQKVCAPKFKEVSCDPAKYKPGHPLADKWEEADGSSGVYVACEMDKLGERGCGPVVPPDPGTDGCDDGLVLNAHDTCDVADPEFHAVEASLDRKGLDVQDQFCRSFFCDANWVCDARENNPLCKLCTDDGGPGQAGCVEIWVDGAPSSVYTAKDELECGKGGLGSTEDVDIGPVPGA